MLMKSGRVQLRATCSQILSILGSEKLGKILGIARIEGDTLELSLKGEAKDRVAKLKLNLVTGSDSVKLEALNNLGIQTLLAEFTCRESDGFAVVSYSIALNPVALNVAKGVAETTLINMVYSLDKNFASVLREKLELSEEIASKYLNDEFIARAIARGDVLERRILPLKEVDAVSVALRYPQYSLLVSATGEGIDLKLIIVGASYNAKLRYGELEYRGQQAISKAKEIDSEVALTIYRIDKIVT